jgi:hypothetical protein
MSAVISVIIGGVLAGLFTFTGTVYGARREHAQWLRNARLDAYRTFLTAMNTSRFMLGASKRLDLPSAEAFGSALSAVELLGPPPVADAALAAFRAVVTWEETGGEESGSEDPSVARIHRDRTRQPSRVIVSGAPLAAAST